MAEALMRGVLNSGALKPSAIYASDVSAERRQYVADNLKIHATADNSEVVKAADTIVLCVKPQQVDEVLRQIAGAFKPEGHLLASICAGVTTARIEKLLPAGARVVRVMPNTPMLVGMGASCLCGGKNARDDDLTAIEQLFSSA